MIILDKNTFEEEVLKHEGIVVVDFWSEGCEPCKALLPEVEELDNKYKENFKFCKLDTTKARRLAIKEKVLGLPTIAIYKEGQKIDEVTKDDATRINIEEMIKKYL
ncbi:thioredoxin domain-containing protein [Romboutsia sp. 1001216sp1]|uniref:thioredoxin TrxA n=1 Tax=unclassified Romboutsia TaxID=2626894 RepID=UPI0018AC83B4|nr:MULTISPECIES: thioredoxin domain-containing protein [unclassified Romboutsia]MDB8792326.1 thioredoxin domain-containing protein [Romboutsia sp. 1001216sp1]MDB8795621.1 thioredoxin domain-containing protein [Romboutsia sp. 1001216sp1]MDB8798500.1 thioredoxin domain-containing protein [Romboutsia sp. 1001216sp1]